MKDTVGEAQVGSRSPNTCRSCEPRPLINVSAAISYRLAVPQTTVFKVAICPLSFGRMPTARVEPGFSRKAGCE